MKKATRNVPSKDDFQQIRLRHRPEALPSIWKLVRDEEIRKIFLAAAPSGRLPERFTSRLTFWNRDGRYVFDFPQGTDEELHEILMLMRLVVNGMDAYSVVLVSRITQRLADDSENLPLKKALGIFVISPKTLNIATVPIKEDGMLSFEHYHFSPMCRTIDASAALKSKSWLRKFVRNGLKENGREISKGQRFIERLIKEEMFVIDEEQ